MKTLTSFLCITTLLINAVIAQSQLDEEVPYQGDTLLTNPNQYRVTPAGDVLMDCDWPAMMAMIHDLEERIAGETETDTMHGIYFSGDINGNTINMWYDCVVLRDSILSLQLAYNETLARGVTVDAAIVLSDTSAALGASFSVSEVESSGFAWASDATMTSPQNGPNTGTTTPIADTLTGLDAGVVYYFSAYAVTDAEYYYGDTLSLLTMPGITTDAADELTPGSATLNATFSADSIIAQGFVWGLEADLSDGASVSADTTDGSTAIEYALTGLTGATYYYFSAYATNASGTTYGDTLSFSTPPPPSMTITASEVSDGDSSSDATLSLTFTASASTDDFDVADITVTNGALSNFAGSGTTYTATFTPTAHGACTINVAESTFTDAAGNDNTATDEFNWTYVAPAVFTTCGDAIGYDGYDYATVQIGGQCWFAENLRNANYNDGSAIPSGLPDGTWSSTTDGAVTVYDEGGANEATNLETYGRLYNWYAVNTGKLCPSGWHVPTDDEWTTTTDFLGGAATAAAEMKDASQWDGNNSSGFSALAGGFRSINGASSNEGSDGYFWSSSPNGTDAWYRALFIGYTFVDRYYFNLRHGFSVRCVMDPPPSMTITASEVSDGDSSSDATLSLTFTASASTDDFDVADITMTNGALSNFAGSGTTYTATFTPTADGACTINVAGSTFTDAAGNDNIAADEFNWTYAAPFTCGNAIGYDGYDYTTVQIGGQCWFAENLRNANYNDGSAIPSGLDNVDWSSTTDGAVTVYDEGGSNAAYYMVYYGLLYNWYAVNTGKLCPSGWHVPTDTEWTTLENEVINDANALKASASDTPPWNGSNSSGFSALAAGSRSFDGSFFGGTANAYFWSSSLEETTAKYRFLIGTSPAILQNSINLRYGLSVRCVLD